MTAKVEQRSFSASMRSNDGRFELAGIAASYNVPTMVGGQYQEQIAPGAFARALREKQDIRCLFNHSADIVLARTSSSTLTLSDSPEGLRFVAKLDRNNSKHAEIYAMVSRGDVSGCSFSFVVPPGGDSWDTATDEKGQRVQRRTLKDLNVFDIGPVTYPCYQGDATSVSARSAAATGADIDTYHRNRLRELEYEVLRNAPGYRITEDLRVLPMTQAEADLYTDARNHIRAAEIAEQIRRDEALAVIEAAKKELGD